MPTPFSANRRRCATVSLGVSDMNSGATPIGSITTNRVTKAEINASETT